MHQIPVEQGFRKNIFFHVINKETKNFYSKKSIRGEKKRFCSKQEKDKLTQRLRPCLVLGSAGAESVLQYRLS
jgi:hypothetical protein